jgi:outer membrane receptor protein involved in Fe transport
MLRTNARLACIIQGLALASFAILVQAQDAVTPGGSGATAPESVLFENLPVVEVATLHMQTLEAETIDGGTVLQYQNSVRHSASGVELELGGKVFEQIETTASVTIQRATDSYSGVFLTNSPGCVGKFRGTIPLFKDRLRVAAATQYLSARRTLAYAQVPAFWLADLTLTTHARPDFDIQFGVRNLFDRACYDPVGIRLIQDRLRQDGRAGFLKLVWRTRE